MGKSPWLTCILLLVSLAGFSQSKLGDPFIENFEPKEYRGTTTIWDVAQAANGLIYIGDAGGLQSFDGKTWRSYFVSNQTTVRSIDTHKDGTVYVGAKNEFGFFKSDSVGFMQYTSLASQLPEEERTFKDVWNTYVTSSGVYFLTFKRIFRYHQGQLTSIDSVPLSPHLGFHVNDELYFVVKQQGLSRLVDDTIELIKGGELFAKDKIYAILPDRDQNLIVVTRNGLVRFNTETGIGIKLEVDLIDEILFHRTYHGAALPDGTFALATLGGGIFILDRDGKLIQRITSEDGLCNDNIKYLFVDKEANLWAGTASGLSRIEPLLPLNIFGSAHGLTSSARDIIRHNGTLYVATGNGLFYLDPAATTKKERFKLHAFFNAQCWSFEILGEHLLVSSGFGIFEVFPDKVVPIGNFSNVFNLMPSHYHDNHIFACMKEGVVVLKLDTLTDGGTAVVALKPFQNLETEAHKIFEDKDQNLWIATSYNEYHFIRKPATLDGPEVTTTVHNMPDASLGVEGMSRLGNRLFCGTGSTGLYTLEASNDSSWIQPTTVEFIGLDSTGKAMAFNRLPNGKFLIHNHGSFRGNGLFIAEQLGENRFKAEFGALVRLKEVFNHPAHAYAEDDGIIWIGSNEGIVRYDPKSEAKTPDVTQMNIRQVSLGADSIVFAGNGLAAERDLVCDYSHNNLVFDFVATSYRQRGSTRYRYILEPHQGDWSNWSPDTRKEYTNLPEGDYIFRVQSRDIYGNKSSIARHSFSISPPWYRTLWAYSIFGIGLLVVLFILNKLSTYRLQQSKQKLEAIVQDRTREISEEKKVVEEQNEEILAQKTFIEEVNDTLEQKNQDITDSLNYAKHIQKSILPDPAQLQSYFPESFIYYKPRDIVSGDFYWFNLFDGKFTLAAADCTGHGVPGAFMSLICSNLLDKVVLQNKTIKPEEALRRLDEEVISAISQTDTDRGITLNDGMDLGLISIDMKTMKLLFAGALRPLLLIRAGEVQVFKGGRYSVGGASFQDKEYVGREIDLQKDDVIYLFSDGFADQFGGPKLKKLKMRAFTELLLNVHQLPASEQKTRIGTAFTDWKGKERQTDDVLVVGIKI
jgi:serine phosphatase RsbU (regulator of sigma subunit)